MEVCGVGEEMNEASTIQIRWLHHGELLWLKMYGEWSLKIAEFYWLQVRNFMMETRLWMEKINFFYSLKVDFDSSNFAWWSLLKFDEFFLLLSVDSWRPKFGGKLRGNCGCINEDSSGQKLRKLWLHNGEFL